MQKKIIALAIAAAFSAPAFADTANVNVYGAVNAAFEAVTVGDAASGAATGYSANKISSNQTYVGVKGSEDMGNGLSAIWQIESEVAVDAGAGSLGSRNTFVGLSDKAMGTVLLGRHDTPYKISTRALDVFGNSIADNRSLMGGVAATGVTPTTIHSVGASFDGRQNNVIAYISPAMGGVTVAAAYVAGAEDATAATANKGSAMSFAAMYTMDSLYASLAYESHKMGDAGSGNIAPAPALSALTGAKESAIKAGVGYKMDALTLNAAIERTSDDFGDFAGASVSNLLGHTSYYVAAKYDLSSSNAVKVAYTKAGKTNVMDNGGNDDSASQMSVGFDHAMSKRTSVFALYTNINNGDNGTYGFSSVSTGGTGAVAAGSKVSAFSLGLKHSF